MDPDLRPSRRKTPAPEEADAQKAWYQITVEGRFDPSWSEWLGGPSIASDEDPDGTAVTFLTCGIADQAALRGLLNRMWDLNLVVISLVRLESAPDDEP